MRGDAVIQQSRQDSDKMASVSIPVINFVDREFEKERLLTNAERERLREVIMEKFNALREAQTLAYEELQRRLDMLNHAHQEAAAKEVHFQPRELSESQQKEYTAWRDTVNNALNQQVGRMATWGTVLTLIVIAIQVLIHFWR
jgi:hypothetical protein